MKRILDANGNKTQIFHHTEHDNESIIQTVTDADPLVRRVNALREAKRKKYDSEVMNYVGSVDLDLFLEWARRKGINTQEAMADTKFIVQYLNDPDNARFKAIDGKI